MGPPGTLPLCGQGSERVCPAGLAISRLRCGHAAFSVLGLPDHLRPHSSPSSTLRTPGGVICAERQIHWSYHVDVNRPSATRSPPRQDVVSHCQPSLNLALTSSSGPTGESWP